MISEEQKAWLLILIVPAFILIRVVSVKWIEPLMQRPNKPSWLDIQLRSDTFQGGCVSLVLGMLILGIPWLGPAFLQAIDPSFYHPPQKIAWYRITITPIGVAIVLISCMRILKFRRR